MQRISALIPLSALAAITLLIGCALTNTATPGNTVGPLIKGTVHGGQQPVVGAHVYLFAAGTSGYGGAATSLITVGSASGTDTLGNYVTTDSGGSFSVTGDYTCTTGTQVYLLATGGNPGGPQVNANLALMTALGQCPASGTLATALPTVSLNEVTTVASVYALAGFMTDLTHVSSSGTPLSNTGMANAFATVNNLVNIVNGAAFGTTPAGNGTVPQAEINTLANILAACVNSIGASSTPCSTLFSTALNGSTQPTDTVTAALNIAHNPGTGTTALYALGATTPPFAPALTAQPNDFTLGLNFTGGGLNTPLHIAIDGSGNIWVPSGGGLAEFNGVTGAVMSGSGYTHTGQIAIDASGNVWGAASNNIVKLDGATGAVLSPSGGYTGGGISTPVSIAFDGSGNVWVSNNNGSQSAIAELNGVTGAPISPSTGFAVSSRVGTCVAIDQAGNVWTADNSDARELNASTGALISPANGYPPGGLTDGDELAVDRSGNVWLNSQGIGTWVYELSGSTGAFISPSTGFSGGGISRSYATAVDGANTVWVGSQADSSINRIDAATGTFISGSNGYVAYGMDDTSGLALDGSGNVWAVDPLNNSVTELVGAAAPVVTPLAVAVANKAQGLRP